MNRNLMLSGALACALALSACADMSDTQRRTGTGAAIGGAAAGIITGKWGWAAAGAAVGAASGYLYDQNQKEQEAKQKRAYEQGVKDGQNKK
jgi:osmotically inducible lipoprotein OsmB